MPSDKEWATRMHQAEEMYDYARGIPKYGANVKSIYGGLRGAYPQYPAELTMSVARQVMKEYREKEKYRKEHSY